MKNSEKTNKQTAFISQTRQMSGQETKQGPTCFIGLSHLGLVTSISWASLRQKVIGIDTDENVISSLKKGKTLIMEDGVVLNEPGLQELFKKVKKNYYPTSDFSRIAECDLVFFVKDTPKIGENPENKIFNLIKLATPYFRENTSIVIISQVPVGFCRMVESYVKKSRPELSFSLYHWVDTIVMTTAIQRFLNPERIIIGTSDVSLPFSKELNRGLELFACPVFKMSFESAELTKAAINLYLANSVTFANTLSDFCEAVGANINEIIPALRTDARIGPSAYIKPNLRIAGGHLERDLLMLEKLAAGNKISSGSVGFIIKQNNLRYKWVLKKINTHLKKKNSTICIWGLSYKKDTTSTKNAASIEIIKALKGKTKINVYDPMAIVPKNINGYTRYKDKYKALKGSNCLLILTEWDEFQKTQKKQIKNLMKSNLIIDAVGVMNNRKEELKNFNYISMGTGYSSN